MSPSLYAHKSKSGKSMHIWFMLSQNEAMCHQWKHIQRVFYTFFVGGAGKSVGGSPFLSKQPIIVSRYPRWVTGIKLINKRVKLRDSHALMNYGRLLATNDLEL